MTVFGPLRVGDIGDKHNNKADYDTVTVQRFNALGVAISSSDTVYSSVDGGASWDGGISFPFNNQNSYGPGAGSADLSPQLQRINSRDANIQGIFKLLYYTSTGPGAWGHYNLSFPAVGGELSAFLSGAYTVWVPYTSHSDERKLPLVMGQDYLSNVLSNFGYTFNPDQSLGYGTLDPNGLRKQANHPGGRRIQNDLTFLEPHNTGNYITEVYCTQAYFNIQGMLCGVQCTTLDGWHERPTAQTAFAFIFDTQTMSTWRVSADPARLDAPVGPPVSGTWVDRNGIRFNVDGDVESYYVYNMHSGSAQARPIAIRRSDSYADLTDGWQVRHCMAGNKLYRFVKKGPDASWEFVEIDAFGFEYEDRAGLAPPSEGWVDYADTRFVPTPNGVIAVHIAIDECYANHWQRSADAWSGWELIYTGRVRCTPTGDYPLGTGFGCSKSSPGEYVDIAVQHRAGGSNGVYYYRWSANAAPDNPVILSPDNGEVLNSEDELRIDWQYSDPGGDTQSHYRVRRTIGDEIQYASFPAATGDFDDEYEDSPNYLGAESSAPDIGGNADAYYYDEFRSSWRDVLFTAGSGTGPTRDNSRDIDLSASSWIGGASDGDTLWVVDASSDADAIAYDAHTLARLPTSDIPLLNRVWRGGVSDGTIVWFVEQVSSSTFSSTTARAHVAATGARDSSQDIALTTLRHAWYGGAYDGTYIWFVNDSSNVARAYDPATGDLVSSLDINLGAGLWTGAVSDGVTLWFVDNDRDVARAYTIGTYTRDSSNDINIGSGNWQGGISAGNTLWFVNNGTNDLVAYESDPDTYMWEDTTFASLGLGNTVLWLGEHATADDAAGNIVNYDANNTYLAYIADEVYELTAYTAAGTALSWVDSERALVGSNPYVVLPGGWADNVGDITFQVSVRDSGGRWSGYSQPIVVYADIASAVTIQYPVDTPDLNPATEGDPLEAFSWTYPAGARPNSYRLYLQQTMVKTDYDAADIRRFNLGEHAQEYDTGRVVTDPNNPVSELDLKMVGDVLGLQNGRFTLGIEWWTEAGLKAPVTEITFDWYLAGVTLNNVLVIPRVVNGHGIGFSARALVPNANVGDVVAIKPLKKISSTLDFNYWDVTAVLTYRRDRQDNITGLQFIDLAVASGVDYNYAFQVISNTGAINIVYRAFMDSFSLTYPTISSLNSDEYALLRVANYKRGKEAGVKSGVFADGSQRFIHGFPYLQSGVLKLTSMERNPDDLTPESPEEWLQERQGQEYILRFPEGSMERVLIGDVDVNHEAIVGDSSDFVPGFLTVHRYPDAVEL